VAANILLCDDDIHILRAAEVKLRRAGHRVRTAGDGQEGWEAIEQDRPDLVVTDLQMPRLTGLELAARIRSDERTRDLPVILLTAKGYELARDEVIGRLKLTALLSKPFSPRELAERVALALGPGAPA
jgi:CheY-like chemotaxis protein